MDEYINYGVKLYTRNFDSVNKKLRSKESLGIIENLVMKCLYYSAARNQAPADGMTVYRGTNNFKDIDNFSFISTSTDNEQAKEFSDKSCCLFKIFIGKGEKIIPILKNSYFEEEKEILLPPGSTFTIASVDEKKGVFDMIYNSPENIPDIIMTEKDDFLLKLFRKLSEENIFDIFAKIDDTQTDYIIDLFMKEKLLKRLHLWDRLCVDSQNGDRWKDEKIMRFKNLVENVTLVEKDDLDACSNFPFTEKLTLHNFLPNGIGNLMNLTALLLYEIDIPNLSSNLNLTDLTISECTGVIFDDLSKIIKLKHLYITKCDINNDTR